MSVLEEGLVSYLQGFAGLTALISTRVYAYRIPQSATLPCLTFQRISTPRRLTLTDSGASGTLAYPRIQFDAWAESMGSAKSISDQVRAALMGHTGSTGGVTIRAALVDEERADYEPDTKLYRYQSEYIIWHEE